MTCLLTSLHSEGEKNLFFRHLVMNKPNKNHDIDQIAQYSLVLNKMTDSLYS